MNEANKSAALAGTGDAFGEYWLALARMRVQLSSGVAGSA